MGPRFVVDIAGPLPRGTGNPGAVDEHVDGVILELSCGLPDAFGIHCNDFKDTLFILRQML
jgi:hypothetical protein